MERHEVEAAIFDQIKVPIEYQLGKIKLGDIGVLFFTGLKSSWENNKWVGQWVFFGPEEVTKRNDWDGDGPSCFYTNVPGPNGGPIKRGDLFTINSPDVIDRLSTKEHVDEMVMDGLRRLFDLIIKTNPPWLMKTILAADPRATTTVVDGGKVVSSCSSAEAFYESLPSEKAEVA